MRPDRFYWPALGLLIAATFAAHVLGAGPLRSALWGADLYAFLPRAALLTACGLVAVAVVLALGFRNRLDDVLLSLPRPPVSSAAARIGAVVTVAVFFLAFWLFREGHTLLGDGNPLTHDLPLGQRFHPHEPLTYLVHHWFYELAHGWFARGGRDPAEVAHATVGLSSAIAGALFVPIAWQLARELTLRLGSDPDDDSSRPESATPLVFSILLAQGYAQLFFGYVENYTFNLLVLGIYLLFSLRYLRGAAPLALPGMALALNVSLDLSAVLWIPSFLVLLAKALATTGQRWKALRDLVVIGLFGAGLTALMASIEPGYLLPEAAYWVVLQAIIGHGHHLQTWAYMLSGEHVRDFLNEQMLIGPAAAFLLVAGVLWLLHARSRLTATTIFFLAAGVVALMGAWVTTDLSLGYPRDWDLFAPSGLTFMAAGLYLLMSAPWPGAALRRWLFLLLAVSLFHTVPWVAVNASFDRSFARFKTLPLGLGRTEAVVGSWYVTHGDTTRAITWFQRSLDANPANNLAAYSLGRIGMHNGRYAWAARAFLSALESRPDKEEYRFSLVDALVRGGGRPQWAKPQLDTLLMRNPHEPHYWAAYGVVLLGLGERDSAASAFQRAQGLAPDDSSFTALQRHVSESDGYLRAVREDWPTIVGP